MLEQTKSDETNESEKSGKCFRHDALNRGLKGRIFVSSFKHEGTYMVVGVYSGQAGYIDVKHVSGEKIVEHGDLVTQCWNDPEYDVAAIDEKTPVEKQVNPLLVERVLSESNMTRAKTKYRLRSSPFQITANLVVFFATASSRAIFRKV